MMMYPSSPDGTFALIASKDWRNSEERWRRCGWPITRQVFGSGAPKQGSRSVSSIIVGAALGLTGPQGKQGVVAVQRLNLALVVHAEDQGVIRRVHIRTHEVSYFLDEQGVGRQVGRPVRI